jgi:hypothetical protein
MPSRFYGPGQLQISNTAQLLWEPARLPWSANPGISVRVLLTWIKVCLPDTKASGDGSLPAAKIYPQEI